MFAFAAILFPSENVECHTVQLVKTIIVALIFDSQVFQSFLPFHLSSSSKSILIFADIANCEN